MARPRRSSALDDGIVVVGASSHPLRDAYHSILQMRWSGVLGIIALLFLVANAIFAVGYTLTGGVTGARDGSFRDAFFFSVQTLGTVGYGAMYPTSTAANLLVVAESVVGVILTALATGIVFARFSQSSGVLVFTSHACIGLDLLLLARLRGEPIQRALLVDEVHHGPRTTELRRAVARELKVIQAVEEDAFRGGRRARQHEPHRRLEDGARAVVADAQHERRHAIHGLVASVVGTDDTSLQPVHARKRYEAKDVLWGARPADILSELADGRIQLDVGKFDAVVATQPTATFPYPVAEA